MPHLPKLLAVSRSLLSFPHSGLLPCPGEEEEGQEEEQEEQEEEEEQEEKEEEDCTAQWRWMD